jgi:D-glucosaminate-6-phosphate ammonia-lyase
MGSTIFDRLGTRPLVNARGIYTDLGGSILSPRVWAAMEEANRSYADVAELLDSTGAIVARLVGAEAARITPGASAAIVLGLGACMAGQDPAKQDRLPDTAGMRHEVLVQRRQRYRWDRMIGMAGGRLIEVGDGSGTTPEQLAGAIGAATAAVLVPGHLDGVEGVVPVRELAAIVRERGVPTLVDAAYLNYPVERFGSFLRNGADLTVFSAKYFGGPNTGGFICGRRDLVEAVAALDFTSPGPGERLAFGRPFKLDRQLVVGVVAALEEWLELDHQARFERYRGMVETMRRELETVPHLELTPMWFSMEETLEPEPVNCLHIRFDARSGRTASEVEAALRGGNPSIRVHLDGDALIVAVDTLRDGDAELIAGRLKTVLGRQPSGNEELNHKEHKDHNEARGYDDRHQ